MGAQFYVYILASKKHGTLYTGFARDLVPRTYQHREKQADGFTKRYSIALLVHYEVFADFESALHREKCIKEWKREWKIKLIQENNPQWRDLFDEITK